MNLSRHHNIYGRLSGPRSTPSLHFRPPRRPQDGGYTLVALLAVMTVLALFAMAAAPSIRQQAQREQEKESIFRGEQVADAIRSYYLYRRRTLSVAGDQALPTSMDQLLEGIPVPGGSKKTQILRPSAARDPLSASGEWGFVRPRSQKLINFQRSVMLYADNSLPTPQDTQMIELQRDMVPPIQPILGLESSEPTSQSEDLAAESSGPFIGVASQSKNNSVLYYYGIDHHNGWIFTPLFKR